MTVGSVATRCRPDSSVSPVVVKALARDGLRSITVSCAGPLFARPSRVAIWQTGGEGCGAETPLTYEAPRIVETCSSTGHTSAEPITPQTYMAGRDSRWNGGRDPGGRRHDNDAGGLQVSGSPMNRQLTTARQCWQRSSTSSAQGQATIVPAPPDPGAVDEAARVADKIASVEKAALRAHRAASRQS